MTRLSLFVATASLCASCASGLASNEAIQSSGRRAFLLEKFPAAVAGTAGAAFFRHAIGCGCAACLGVQPAGAYERRDVGGDQPSADMVALNEQAYQTMNRLERDGVKLETAEEQRASLTAALSEYSYSATPSKPEKKKSSSKKKNEDKES